MTVSESEKKQILAEFTALDKKNTKALKSWFQKHRLLKAIDIAVLTGVSVRTIRKLRQSVGIVGKAGKPTKSHSVKKIRTLVAPPNWDAEWVASKYGPYSIYDIAAATGMFPNNVSRYIKNHKIERQPKTGNPCNSYEWLEEHYFNQCLTVRECGKLAGVSAETITRWMAQHGLVTRDKTRISNRKFTPKQPLWGKLLAVKLRERPEVRRVTLKERGIIVRYTTMAKDVFWFLERKSQRGFELHEVDSRVEKIPKTYEQYDSIDFDSKPFWGNFHIKKSEWRKANTVEKRLGMNAFVKKLMTAGGWIQPSYPDEMLRKELSWFLSNPPERYIRDGGIEVGSGKCRHVIFHYFNLSYWMERTWRTPRKMNSIARKIGDGVDPKINTHAFLALAMKRHGPKVVTPDIYTALLKSMGVGEGCSVLDIDPGLGEKALACAKLGINYVVQDNDNSKLFLDACTRGFDKFINLKWEIDDGRSVHDVVMGDHCMHYGFMDMLNRNMHRGKSAVGYAPAARLNDMEEEYTPDRIVDLIVNGSKIGHLLIW